MQYLLIALDWYGLFAIFIPVYLFRCCRSSPSLAAIPPATSSGRPRCSGLMIARICISSVPALLTLDIPGYEGRNLLLIAWLIIVVQLSDVLQYVCGKLFGKHKIAPNLSPSKTVEGLIGGVALATLIGAMLCWITPFTFWQAALFALLVCRPRLRRWPGDVGDQARPWGEGLGPYDRRPRRHARPPGLGVLRCTGVLPYGALLVGSRAPSLARPAPTGNTFTCRSQPCWLKLFYLGLR